MEICFSFSKYYSTILEERHQNIFFRYFFWKERNTPLIKHSVDWLDLKKKWHTSKDDTDDWSVQQLSYSSVNKEILQGKKAGIWAVAEPSSVYTRQRSRDVIIQRKLELRKEVWNWNLTSWVLNIFGEGNGYPLQYSSLEYPTDRGAWQAIVHGVTNSQTWQHSLNVNTSDVKKKKKKEWNIIRLWFTNSII